MTHDRALISGFEAIHVDLHRKLDHAAIQRRDESRELDVRQRVGLLVEEVETLRRRVALLTHVERAPQLGDDEDDHAAL